MQPSNTWQTVVIPAKNLLNRRTTQPMSDWSKTSDLLIMPALGSNADISKVIFAEFKWVPSQP